MSFNLQMIPMMHLSFFFVCSFFLNPQVSMVNTESDSGSIFNLVTVFAGLGESDSASDPSQRDQIRKDKTMMLFNRKMPEEYPSWMVVDDVVMGGRSNGKIDWTKDRNFVFEGRVSLENNGGFSSIRSSFEEKKVSPFSRVCIRLKGDGKRYQFRLKSSQSDRYSFARHFHTSGEWETIKIPLREFYPTFRGRKLDLPNYPAQKIAEISFLIANNQAEQFRLEIDRVYLQ